MAHPLDVDLSTCIDCRLYAGLCPVHAHKLLEEARKKYVYASLCIVCNVRAMGGFCKECGSQKDCGKCNNPRASKDPFCSNCGEQYKITEGAAAGNPVLTVIISTETRFCEECGRSNPGGYCTYCGTPFVLKPKELPAETPKSPCPQCKTPRVPDHAFCINCGYAPTGRRASRKVTIFQNKALRVYCVSCGGPAGKGTFCIYCGVKYHKEQRKDQYDFAGEATPAESPIQKPDVEKLKKAVSWMDQKEIPSPTARTSGKAKTFGEQLRERQQQGGDWAPKPLSPSSSSTSFPSHPTKNQPQNSSKDFKKSVREVVTTDPDVLLSPKALKQFMDMWAALPEDQKDDNAREIRKTLEVKSKPLIRSTSTPPDVAATQLLKDSGAGPMTNIHLTTLQEQGKQFDSVSELAKEVKAMHASHLQRKDEEKELLINVLNDSIIWTTLFPSDSTSSGSRPVATTGTESSSPLMRSAYSSSSSRLPTTQSSSVPMLTREQISELVAFEHSASGVVNLLTDLRAKGRKYTSTDQILTEAKALSLTRRQDILSYLNDPKCKLFPKSSKIKESDVEKLYQLTGAGSENLRHIKDLAASGKKFDNFEAMIPSIMQAHEKRVQQILKVFPHPRPTSESTTTRPTSESTETRATSPSTEKKSSKPAPSRPAPRIRSKPAEPEKTALKTALKIEIPDQVSEEFIEDLLMEGETVGETMDLVSELKDAGVHLEEIPPQDLPSAFRAARIHRLATLKSIQAVTSGHNFKKILNYQEMNLEQAEKLYQDGKQGARTPQILKSMVAQGANFATMEQVVEALQTYKDDGKVPTLTLTIDNKSTDSDILPSERSQLIQRVVTEKEKKRFT